MSTTFSASITAQEKPVVAAAAENVKFSYFSHDSLWDTSLSSTARKVGNLFVECLKYFANAFIWIANNVHAKLFAKNVVKADIETEPKPAEPVLNPEPTPIVVNPAPVVEKPAEVPAPTTEETAEIEIDSVDEGIPAEENQGSWLGTAAKASAYVTLTAAVVGAVSLLVTARTGHCATWLSKAPTWLQNFCNHLAPVAQ